MLPNCESKVPGLLSNTALNLTAASAGSGFTKSSEVIKDGAVAVVIIVQGCHPGHSTSRIVKDRAATAIQCIATPVHGAIVCEDTGTDGVITAGRINHQQALVLTVTTAPFQEPDCQVKAPLITFVPTRAPGCQSRLVDVTVPLMVKPPLESHVNRRCWSWCSRP